MTFRPLGGLVLDLSLSTHAAVQKSYKFPIDFAQHALYDHLFGLQVGSRSGVAVDANTIGIVEPNPIWPFFQ